MSEPISLAPPPELLPYDGPLEFVHLHNHTVFSQLDGVATPEQYFAECKKRGYPAMAITEHGHMASVPDNYWASAEHKIKYIPGCEVYYNDFELQRQQLAASGGSIRELKVSDPILHAKMSRNRHMTILAKDQTGFHNLVKLTTQAYDTGFYYRPRVWFDKVAEYSEGLIVLSGCLNGPVSTALRNGEIKVAEDYIVRFKALLGDRYWIEVQMPCLIDVDDRRIFAALFYLAKKHGLKVVLANDCHYLTRKEFFVQKVMMAVDQGLTVDSPDLFHVNSDEQYMKDRQELWTTFKTKGYDKHVTDADFHTACDNTILLAQQCTGFIPDKSPKVPNFPGANEQLIKMVYESLKAKGKYNDTKKYFIDNRYVTYLEQAKIELQRFIEKNFASYFLITADFIKFSLDNGWPVGPRGSVGGSLVCHLLGISSLDPLHWELSFDRFLSPSRGGMMLNIKAE